MKKFILSLVVLSAFAGAAIAQSNLEPTKLGKWTRPADTDIAAVDKYVKACADLYQEAMDIREQYDAIEAPDVSLDAVSEEALGESEALNEKKAEYQAVIDRIVKQKDAVTKLPDLLTAATAATPKGLKAVQTTKNITATKNAVKLAIEENAAVLKAATQQLANLGSAPADADEE